MKAHLGILCLVVGAILTVGFVSNAYAQCHNGENVEPPTISASVLTAPGVGVFEITKPLQEYEVEHGHQYKLKSKFSYELVDNDTMESFGILEIEEIEFDPDPSVFNNYILTNTTSSTQTYSIPIVVSTTFPAPNLISGSITTQVIDGGTDGATVAAPTSGSIYNAMIDGTVIHTLQDDPFSLYASGGVNNALAAFGPITSTVPVNSSIGVQLDFTLTAGDSAAFLSRFDVVIPEPSTVLLAVFGLVGILLLARRR